MGSTIGVKTARARAAGETKSNSPQRSSKRLQSCDRDVSRDRRPVEIG